MITFDFFLDRFRFDTIGNRVILCAQIQKIESPFSSFLQKARDKFDNHQLMLPAPENPDNRMPLGFSLQ